MKNNFFISFFLLGCMSVILSCSGDRITDCEETSNVALQSRSFEDYEFELPVTDTPAMMDFIEEMERRCGNGTLVTDDGALYVDASYPPLSIRIYYNRINSILKAVMIATSSSYSSSSVKYAIEQEMTKVINNNNIQYQIQGFTATPSGSVQWPDMDNVEAEVVIDHDGDTIGVYPPLPFNIYYSKRQEVITPSVEKTPFNINFTIPSRI